MVSTFRQSIMQLIEEDVGENPVGRSRRFLENQRAQIPDRGDLLETHHGFFRAKVFEYPVRLAMLPPTMLITHLAESGFRYHLRRKLRQNLSLARAILAEMSATEHAGTAPAPGAPFRLVPDHLGQLSPAGLLLVKAERVLLISYRLGAPLPWVPRRQIEGMSLAVEIDQDRKLLLNAFNEAPRRPFEHLAAPLGAALRSRLGKRFLQETWRWVRNTPESLELENS